MKKYVIAIPVILLLLCAGYLLMVPLDLDVDLKGGTQISIEYEKSISSANLEDLLSDYSATVRVARGLNNYVVLIEFDSGFNSADVLNVLEDNGYGFEDYSVQTINPSLGAEFFKQAQLALGLAFVFMAIVVFALFKKLLPSFYVVMAAGTDIVETLVISQLLGIDLSLAIFAALLLTVGYSVDSDILLTTRVLKGHGELKDKIKNAFKTSITMSMTTLAAMTALYLLSTSVVIKQIASILIIALLVDLFNTWIFNCGLLKWYMERKKL